MESRNFIEDIIIEDIESGRVKAVATRFPPEPNGYLHIGHAKAICLNFTTAKRFGGTCNLRFDDTNPTKEEDEFCNAIIEDVKWLGFSAPVLYSSDYFPVMFDAAVRLIKKGLAYVCDMTADEIRDNRGTLTEPGKNSPYRDRSVEENLKMFMDMRAAKYKDGEKVLRAKIDMASPNINMRDPVIYRVLHAHHHRTKDQWCVYPMYDFAHPIEDAVEKISHSICTLEFEDHRPLYDFVIRECEFTPAPRQFEFARLNLTRTIMSKRYLKKLVDSGVVNGWDDPRMPTLAGMRRRGYPAEAIRDFCDVIGVAKSNSIVDAGLLEHCVRNVLNREAKRVMAVLDPIKLIITDYNGEETLKIEDNPQDENPAMRDVPFSNELYIERDDFMLDPPPKYHRLYIGGTVRLKGAYIIRCEGCDRDENGNVTTVYCTHIPDSKSGGANSGIKVKGVIHFVSAKHCIDITVNRLDYLLLPDETGKKDFSELINPDSLKVYRAKGEPSLAIAGDGAYQFLRLAYFSKDPKIRDELVFNEIVGLKDTYKGN